MNSCKSYQADLGPGTRVFLATIETLKIYVF